MSEEIGKEVLERVDINDPIERMVTTAKDILEDTRISINEVDEIVDTPTPLAAGTKNKFVGIGLFLLIGVVIWYFFLRRKK